MNKEGDYHLEKPHTEVDFRQGTQADQRNKIWDGRAETYWKYVPGKRAKLPTDFENFYQSHKSEFKDALDIGCGTGRFLIPMLEDGVNAIGLEPSNGMRGAAAENLKTAGFSTEGRLVEGESKSLNFPDASFDYVLAKGSIHHNTWHDIEQSFQEVARVLRPEKFFLFQGRTINDSALNRSATVPDVGVTAQDPESKPGVNEHYFNESEIFQLARENFKVVLGPQEVIRDNENWKTARLWVVYQKL